MWFIFPSPSSGYRGLGRPGLLNSRQDCQEPRWKSGSRKADPWQRTCTPETRHRSTDQPRGLPQGLSLMSHTHRLCQEQCQGLQKGNEDIWGLHCPCGNLFPSGLSAIVETMMQLTQSLRDCTGRGLQDQERVKSNA